MSRVRVNIFANLREYTDGKASVDLDVPPGGTIADVVAQLGIPSEKTKIIFKNNRAARLDDPLEGGERIDLFSAIGGG